MSHAKLVETLWCTAIERPCDDDGFIITYILYFLTLAPSEPFGWFPWGGTHKLFTKYYLHCQIARLTSQFQNRFEVSTHFCFKIVLKEPKESAWHLQLKERKSHDMYKTFTLLCLQQHRLNVVYDAWISSEEKKLYEIQREASDRD
jgi:hypothetical protein